MNIPLAERMFIKDRILERKMVIGEVEVIATERKRKGKKKTDDKRIKRKMVKTDAAHAQSMELLELNTKFSSLYTDTDVITLEYQSLNRLDFLTLTMECDRYGVSD
ncbi:hypothetical protein AVEN_191965-1 [Araneus ventricosus]|uniref:Uncharacterized protein n=1 Tax=Araneus ventricosus TaxID=182803 RepID=A0A4Y2L7K0_ARAVE|nr:hypothetical protein AVEN_191965-1 [Araneus ventricosus]